MLLALKNGLLPQFISPAPPVTEVVLVDPETPIPSDESVAGGTMDSFHVVPREPVIDIDNVQAHELTLARAVCFSALAARPLR